MSHDEYWQDETPFLFNGIFASYRDQPRSVVGRVHQSQARYDLSEADALIRTVAGRGMCTYIHLRPNVEEHPFYRTGAARSSTTSPDPVSTEIAGQRGAPRLREIGNVEAWYYPEPRVCCLWEAYLEQHLRGPELITDCNMRALWLGVIAWVQGAFPDCARISTPFRDLRFPTDQYQAFLRMLGFKPVAQAAFGMDLTPDDDRLGYSQCLRCNQRFQGEWCPRCEPLYAREYERSTPDEKYRAWCTYRSGYTGNHWVFWSISPYHNPGSGTRCNTFEEARKSVDWYLDEQVPKMLRERQ